MFFSKRIKLSVIVFMTIFMSSLPNVLLADSVINNKEKMISTEFVLANLNRDEVETQLRDALLADDVQKVLIAQGLTANEVSSRLATLSNQEIQQLSVQVKEARAGGDILVAILLIVLIIYLFKRI